VLLGQQQREAEPVRQRGPSGATIITGRALCAAVQNDNEGAIFPDLRRKVGEHAQVAGVGAEIPNFLEVT
jgi:hypothetical protein